MSVFFGQNYVTLIGEDGGGGDPGGGNTWENTLALLEAVAFPRLVSATPNLVIPFDAVAFPPILARSEEVTLWTFDAVHFDDLGAGLFHQLVPFAAFSVEGMSAPLEFVLRCRDMVEFPPLTSPRLPKRESFRREIFILKALP
jgi:hypothetical protein